MCTTVPTLSVMCGLPFAGKSTIATALAEALGVQICRQRRRVMFTKTSAFLADLAGGRAEGNWQTRLRRYLTPDLVILDDFAMREYTLTRPRTV